MCENGACAIDMNSCLNEVGCPKNIPIKCWENGLCALSDIDCETKATEASLQNNCSLSKPYRCDEEGSECVSDINECDFLTHCPADKPTVCADKTCAVDKETCLA